MASIPIGADASVKYYGAKDAITATYLNTGTCTYSLQGLDGTVIGTGTLSYVAASNGNYLGVIDATVTGTLVENTFYNVVITFVQGDYDDKRTLALMAQRRAGS